METVYQSGYLGLLLSAIILSTPLRRNYTADDLCGDLTSWSPGRFMESTECILETNLLLLDWM